MKCYEEPRKEQEECCCNREQLGKTVRGLNPTKCYIRGDTKGGDNMIHGGVKSVKSGEAVTVEALQVLQKREKSRRSWETSG